MITVKEIFDKVKAAFDAPVVVPAAPVAAASTPVVYKTADGQEISVEQAGEKPAAGDKVTIAGAPAPMADYVLEDGTTICVDETGTVTACTEAMPADPAAPAAPEAPEMDMKTKCEELAARITALETELAKVRQPATQMAEVATALAKVEKSEGVMKLMFELVEQMVKQPTADPKTLPENQKSKFQAEKEKNQKRFEAMGSAIADVKKY